MAKLGINTGSSPDAGDGDSLLVGALKINSNFDEIYSTIGNGSNITNSIGYASTAGIATYASVSRVVIKDSGSTVGTAGTIDFGDNLAVSAVSAGVVTVTAGTPSYFVSNSSGINTTSNVGIGTTNSRFFLEVGPVGASGTSLHVNGNARVTGILTVGSSSIILNGYDDTITVGTGVTIEGNTGIVRATEFYADGVQVGIITADTIIYEGSTLENNWFATSAGIHTLSNVGIGTTDPGEKLQVDGNIRVGISTTSNYIAFRGTYKDGNPNDGVGEESFLPYEHTYIGERIYDYSGIGEKSELLLFKGNDTSGVYGPDRIRLLSAEHRFDVLGFTTSGTFEQVGVSTAAINAVTINSTGLGVGTTNPSSALTVQGNVSVSGVVTASSYGPLNSSSLNISGITTISAGRIQVDAASNLRFGNLPAGSGSARNIAIGDQVLTSLSGGLGRNIGIGELSYYSTTSGQYNIGLGIQAGQRVTTGSYNVILGAYDGNSGNLDIRTSSNNVVIADGQGNIRQYINSSGNVGIKTTVVTEALTVAGIVSATSFYGTLNAGQLTGALPALDGSALTGVVGSGSGVVIEDDATPVGTAGTINFGSNLSVSFASGTATVTGSGLATYANVSGIATYATTAGFATASNTATYSISSGISTTSGTAGYASTAGISSAVSGTININTTGIITASSFSGSGANLTSLPAGQLTGSLPAIDGSALLNVTAAGAGVVIEDDQVNVGSATTIDFGTGLDVTFSAGIATITASGGSLQSRTIVTGVTTSIANNGIGNTNITGFKSYALMKVGLSTAGWLRLYTDSASRDADVSRSVGVDPTPGSGVIAEVVTTGISTTQIISPFVMGGNLDNPADTTIYAAITNLSGSTQAITANLTILQLES